MRTPALPILLVVLALPAGLTGCIGSGGSEPADVVATFYPLAFLAQEIGGPSLRVETLVPNGIEPHEWEPTPGDLARAGGARIFLAQGAGFEPWLPNLRESLGAKAPAIVYTTSGLPLVEGGHDDHGEEGEHAGEAEGEHADEAEANHSAEAGHEAEGEHEGEAPLDPHTWLDPVLFAEQARLVAAALGEAFPAEREAIQARADRLRSQLLDLDREYKTTLGDACATRVIITTHDAFGYLARRYDLEVVAISGLSPEAEPSPQDLRRAIEAAREHNITIVFFEELVSPRVAQVVAGEIGGSARVLSPIEGLDAAARQRGEDYFSLMRQNLVNLREAMGCP